MNSLWYCCINYTVSKNIQKGHQPNVPIRSWNRWFRHLCISQFCAPYRQFSVSAPDAVLTMRSCFWLRAWLLQGPCPSYSSEILVRQKSKSHAKTSNVFKNSVPQKRYLPKKPGTCACYKWQRMILSSASSCFFAKMRCVKPKYHTLGYLPRLDTRHVGFSECVAKPRNITRVIKFHLCFGSTC